MSKPRGDLIGPGPHALVVGPHTYQVRFVADVDKAEAIASGRTGKFRRKHAYGSVNHRTGALFVGIDMHGTQQADSLLHEVLHICLAQTGQDDELLVHGLAPSLLDALRRNPWFTDFLLKARDNTEATA